MADVPIFGQLHEEVASPSTDLSKHQSGLAEAGWRLYAQSQPNEVGQILYQWRFDGAPSPVAPVSEPVAPETSKSRFDNPVVGVLGLIGLALVVMAIGGGIGVATNDGEPQQAAHEEPEPSYESNPRVYGHGAYPAPPSDPCWKLTEEAVDISPGDGGQSAMPQRCIERGF